MKNSNQQARAVPLIIGLLACLVGLAAGAQQSGTSPKAPAKTPSSSSSPGAGTANPSTPASPKVVLKIGDTQITQSDLESMVPMRPSGEGHILTADARRRMAEALVRIIALSQQAVNDHLEASPDLRFKLEMQRFRTLAQAELDKMKSQIQITPDEIHQYYAQHSLEFDTVQVREFLVRKHATTGDAGSPGFSAEEAKATAESIRKRLASGDSPEKIAEDFSSPDVLLIDRKPRTLRQDEMIPALGKATFEAKEGTVPESVDTPDAVIVVDLFKHQHVEEKEAATEIEKKLRQLRLEAQIDGMKKKVGIWMDDTYFKDDAGQAPVSTAQRPASDPN